MKFRRVDSLVVIVWAYSCWRDGVGFVIASLSLTFGVADLCGCLYCGGFRAVGRNTCSGILRPQRYVGGLLHRGLLHSLESHADITAHGKIDVRSARCPTLRRYPELGPLRLLQRAPRLRETAPGAALKNGTGMRCTLPQRHGPSAVPRELIRLVHLLPPFLESELFAHLADWITDPEPCCAAVQQRRDFVSPALHAVAGRLNSGALIPENLCHLSVVDQTDCHGGGGVTTSPKGLWGMTVHGDPEDDTNID
ncbi:hypothetical protein NDU88_001833 [Pleurodeles waltl]|uniref:Uncharacterized protein n=1 Tax=Pleurodeles waltl TaxID=8319 RepID=A0AAV7U7Z3_PLEWA|nr:hypothetical protein NDU88_001833 [Pleurodeles waltl]